jgi:hypothetical protein
MLTLYTLAARPRADAAAPAGVGMRVQEGVPARAALGGADDSSDDRLLDPVRFMPAGAVDLTTSSTAGDPVEWFEDDVRSGMTLVRLVVLAATAVAIIGLAAQLLG